MATQLEDAGISSQSIHPGADGIHATLGLYVRSITVRIVENLSEGSILGPSKTSRRRQMLGSYVDRTRTQAHLPWLSFARNASGKAGMKGCGLPTRFADPYA
jgi:hypothetical protein